MLMLKIGAETGFDAKYIECEINFHIQCNESAQCYVL